MKKHYGLSLLPFLLMGLMMAPPRAKRPSGKQDVTSPKTDSQQKGTAVIGQSRTLMPDGHWLILGGETPTGFLNMGEIQDSSTGAVTPLAHGLSEARAWHTAT